MTSPSQGKVGTTVVEGLIEGPVPPREDGEAILREWATFAGENGFHFDLSIDGASFSLLPDGTPLSLEKAGDPQDTLRQVIDQLLQVFPEDLRGSIFSTIRSTEYRDGVMVQTVYAMSPKGVFYKRYGLDLRHLVRAWCCAGR